MEHRGDLRDLCAELATLHRALGAALHPVPADAGAPGVLVSAALTATTPHHGTRRRAPAGAAPLDLDVLAAQLGIGAAAVDLAREARHALGDLTRDHDPPAALAALPMLFGRLPSASPLAGRLPVVLEAARRRARYALDLDRRPLTLAECPSVQSDYLATWCGGYTVAAEWVDGVCREFDVEASVRATRVRRTAAGREVEPVEVWRRSVLYCRDPAAAVGSEDRAVRCPGCRRTWTTPQEWETLHALLWDREG